MAVRSSLVLSVLALVPEIGCAPSADAPAARPVTPAQIVTLAPAPPPPPAQAPPPAVVHAPKAAPGRTADLALPPAWLSPPPATTSFTEGVTTARALRARLRAMPRGTSPDHASVDTSADGAALAWLSKALELRERADRAYAEAWVAQDATAEGKVEVLSEAMLLANDLRAMLAAAGYEEIPASWKAEPTLHATFEDIANGPVRRLTEESQALAVFCARSVAESHVTGRAADACKRAAGVERQESQTQDKSGCACAKGDPLCTTSSWCK